RDHRDARRTCGSGRQQLLHVGAASHEGDVGCPLEHPDEVGLEAVRHRREDAGHGPAAETPPGTGTRVIRAPASTSATTSRTESRGTITCTARVSAEPPSTPSCSATRTTDTDSRARSGPANVGRPTVVPSLGRL